MRASSRFNRRTVGQHWLPGIVLGISVSACSDYNIEVSTPLGDRSPPPIQQGIFRPGNVEGLDFSGGGESGVTDALGTYSCTTGGTVSFSIGNVQLGETRCATVVHPVSLSDSGTLLDPKSINMTRLLLILDEDESPENGIRVSAELRALAEGWAPIDFLADDFEAELTQVISDIASAENRTVEVPSATQAYVTLDTSLSCAYSGVFISIIPSGPFNQPTTFTLVVYRDAATAVDVADFLLIRNHWQSQVYKDGSPVVELAALPTFEGDGVTGAYESPDVVGGNYMNAFAQQNIDLNGTFGVSRLNTNSGEYRLTGKFERLANSTGISITKRVMIELILNGDTLTGESFDLDEDGLRAVTGKRRPDSNVFDLEVEPFDRTATATLLFDDAGRPSRLVGNWPGFEDELLDLAVCRLN